MQTYSAWDDNGNQTYYESRVWNGTLMELHKYIYNYDSSGRMTYYECINNDETWYYHILQTYDFTGTDASSYIIC